MKKIRKPMEKQKTTEIKKNTEQRLSRYGNPWKHIEKNNENNEEQSP